MNNWDKIILPTILLNIFNLLIVSFSHTLLLRHFYSYTNDITEIANLSIHKFISVLINIILNLVSGFIMILLTCITIYLTKKAVDREKVNLEKTIESILLKIKEIILTLLSQGVVYLIFAIIVIPLMVALNYYIEYTEKCSKIDLSKYSET